MLILVFSPLGLDFSDAEGEEHGGAICPKGSQQVILLPIQPEVGA